LKCSRKRRLHRQSVKRREGAWRLRNHDRYEMIRKEERGYRNREGVKMASWSDCRPAVEWEPEGGRLRRMVQAFPPFF
jgi:hypothetical protein